MTSPAISILRDVIAGLLLPSDPPRQQREPKDLGYNTVSRSDAESQGYRPITTAYTLRQHAQRDMLDRAIQDHAGSDVLLVHSDDLRKVTIYRRQAR